MAKRNNRKVAGSQQRQDSNVAEYQRFASISASSVKSGNNTGLKGVTEARLKTMLQDPTKSATDIAGISKTAKQVNGIYKRVIKYMSSLLTYDHLLYPVFTDPASIDNDEVKESFSQVAIYLDRLNPKFNLPIFAEKAFTNGSVFLYKEEDNNSIAYSELPLSYCRISYMEDGVYRYEMDISKMGDNMILSMPKEIQTAYESFKAGNKDKFVDGKWYQVSEKGVAFTLDADAMVQGGMSVPPLANSLLDAIKIENSKDTMEADNELDNMKIFHSQIETDDHGRPLMELPVVKEYHNAVKRALPKGAVAITNPFNTKALSMNGTGKDGKFSLLDKSIDQMYKSLGVSPQLFAHDNTNSQALQRSIQVDCQWLYSFVLPMFTNYYNYELRNAIKSKAFSWRIKFLQISHFDREDSVKTAKDQLSYGGSRLEYLAYTGMTPLETINMLAFEQSVLDIDSLMVAKQNSHTISKNEMEAGRPKTEDPSSKTVDIKDAE